MSLYDDLIHTHINIVWSQPLSETDNYMNLCHHIFVDDLDMPFIKLKGNWHNMNNIVAIRKVNKHETFISVGIDC